MIQKCLSSSTEGRHFVIIEIKSALKRLKPLSYLNGGTKLIIELGYNLLIIFK